MVPMGYDLAIDGIYQPDKIEGPTEVISGVGNVQFIDEKKIISNEEEYLVRRPGKEPVDDVVEYINEFFKRGRPLKEKKILQKSFHRKNQYQSSTSNNGSK